MVSGSGPTGLLLALQGTLPDRRVGRSGAGRAGRRPPLPVGRRSVLLEEAREVGRARQALDLVVGLGRDAVLDRARRDPEHVVAGGERVVGAAAVLGQAERAGAVALLVDLLDRRGGGLGVG